MFIVHCSHGATLIFDDVFYHGTPNLWGMPVFVMRHIIHDWSKCCNVT